MATEEDLPPAWRYGLDMIVQAVVLNDLRAPPQTAWRSSKATEQDSTPR